VGLIMSRSSHIRYSACGCMFLLWAATALADSTAEPNSPSPSDAATDDCPAKDDCIDQYLWSVYERTPKIDAVTVSDKRRVTVRRKGKTRTVVTTVTRTLDEDFAWKDVKAAEKSGLSLLDYVIGGMDRGFKRTLYDAVRAMDSAGLAPGITSAFRDNYRQSIATGHKAQVDRSYHGGSSRGGYGHGLAVDLVSVKGATRAERCRSSQDLWKWIDLHGKDVGIGRPYLDRDAPHVAPIDGQEYADHRGGATTRLAEAKTTTPRRQARHDVRRSRHASAVRSSKHAIRHSPVHRPILSAKGRAHRSTT
jgi:hypothetical protein